MFGVVILYLGLLALAVTTPLMGLYDVNKNGDVTSIISGRIYFRVSFNNVLACSAGQLMPVCRDAMICATLR